MAKKTLTMLITVILVMTLLAGSAIAENPYDATVVYYAANDPRDLQHVEDAMNALTIPALNIRVHLMPMTFGTYGQQMQLLLSSNDPLDIVPFGSGDFGTFIESGYIVDLNDYLEEYGQDIIEIVGMDDIQCTNMNGFLAAIPNMHERTNPNYIIMRTDLLIESGYTADDIHSIEDMTKVYEALHPLYPDMILYGGSSSSAYPILMSSQFDSLNATINGSFGVLENYGQTTSVTNLYESEAFMKACQLMHEWYDAGYISKDFATTTDSGESLMRAGSLFSFTTNGKPNTKQEKDAQIGMDTTCIKIAEDALYTTVTNQLCYGIATNSKNPAKAMELLNFIFKTKEANDLLNWGVEGIDFIVQEDGTINYPEGINASNVQYHQAFGFAMPNQYNSYVWDGNEPDVFEQYQAVRDNALVSEAYGFLFDSAPVLDEWSALSAVGSQYLSTIASGSVDPVEGIQQFNQALYNAGLQRVINEKQNQLNDWLKNK